jgi:23S rRNA (adenine2503-C2)-methyltransferase
MTGKPNDRPGGPDLKGNVPLTDLTPEEIAERLDLKPYQGKQVFHWLHRKGVFDFDAMTDLSKDLREQLKATCVANQLTPIRLDISARSGAQKTLFHLREGDSIEAVFLPDRDRITLCLSAQAGCALNCSFCATGQSGFRRNLSAGEIVEQALFLLGGRDLGGRTPNIVHMGMGEPFRNYDAVMKSIRLLMQKDGLNIGARKITVSTVGDVPGIRRFATEGWQVRLAVSLHAANDRLRSQLVPLNRTYPLAVLMRAVRSYVTAAGRQVSFEWILLRDVNDSHKDAEELAELLGDLKAVVNLIPYNPVPGLDYAPSPRAACEAFCNALIARRIQATLRRERGQDIDAACGQLRLRKLERNPRAVSEPTP